MKKNPIIRSIDLGFGFTKYDKTKKETNVLEYHSFPSIAPRASTIDMSAGILGKRDTVFVNVDGTRYEIGPDSVDLESAEVIRSLNDNYIFTEQYKAITYGALYYMQESEIDLLVVGLPVQNLHQSEELKNLLLGKHQINEEFETNIKNVLVLAQPLGGLYYCMHCVDNEEFEDLKEEKNLVIDPGYLTFDFILSNGDKVVENKSDSKPGGVVKVLESIAKSISEKFGTRYENFNAIDKGLRKDVRKIKISGKTELLDEHIKNTKNTLEMPITYMTNIIRDFSDIDNVILLGGGAKIFERTIKNFFKNRDVYVLENSQFCIVKGYQSAGEKYYEEYYEELEKNNKITKKQTKENSEESQEV